MGDVDEALSRAYAHAQRTATGKNGVSASVPPTPHRPPRRPVAQAPASASDHASLASRTPQPESAAPAARKVSGRPMTRHRPEEAHRSTVSAIGPVNRSLTTELEWPEIVLVLERDWSVRFEAMADRLLETRDRQNMKVLLFTSCHRSEGRTTLVLTVARALARRPGRTVLVDADLTGPMLSRCLGVECSIGLDDVVESGHAVADALVHAADDNLWVLPLRSAVARPRDFLASPGWSCTMAWLRREFDLVLVDGSPLFTGLSAAVLHRSVDAAVLVHHRGMTGERSLLRAREVLEAGGVTLLGLAETFV
ncbi:MAG: CpsD/CapB family tyrosine-protein kinase [Isosphaeraceae bacterium]